MAFIFSIFLFVITGAFCSAVANEKGYNAFWWFILGFLFNLVALIAVVGMPDRKLRKYIRQIGEKQNAISPEPDYEKDAPYSDKNEKPLTPEERKEMIKSLGKKKN